VVGLVGAELAGPLPGLLPHVDGDDPARSAQLQELEQAEAHVAEADERHPVGQFDPRPPLGVDKAGEGFAEGAFVGDALWDRQDLRRLGEAELGVGPVEEPRDPVALAEPRDPRPDLLDDAGRLVPEPVRVGADAVGPGVELRGADAADVDPDQHLARPRLGVETVDHLRAVGSDQLACAHRDETSEGCDWRLVLTHQRGSGTGNGSGGERFPATP
jgi:hypothetical protein